MPVKTPPRLAGRGKTKSRFDKYNTPQLSRKFDLKNYSLPSPREYYSRLFPELPSGRDWGKVICPFHDDHHPSLSINLRGGFFKCHSCGAGGGGITKFHMMRSSLSFQEAIQQLEEGQW